MARLTIFLDEDERGAVTELAQRELRWPRDQIRLIVRAELARQGLLSKTPKIINIPGYGDDRKNHNP